MTTKSPFMQSYQQLPTTLPVFPLGGAVVMPGGRLPLNIFEARYLNMLRDAMKSDQLIGMIQPKDELTPATLHSVGCAARVIQYTETDDGRLEVLLAGLSRFEIDEELSSMRGYRLIKPNWQNFEHDFTQQEPADAQHSLLFTSALRSYFKRHNIEVDWAAIEDLPQEALINNLVAQLPISHSDKQLLIEASTLADRVKSFTLVLSETENAQETRH
ncbi:MAG: Lon protease-like protein [Arenicella sp.]|jgi:Lon protease-like protein